MRKRSSGSILVAGGLFIGSLSLWYLSGVSAPVSYDPVGANIKTAVSATSTATSTIPAPFVVTHLSTPKSVKAIYLTSWVAGDKSWRDSLINLIKDTELNSIVIDIKDYSGGISFLVDDPILNKVGAAEDRIPNIKEFIGFLHQNGIYVIGRLSAFQDPKLVKARPDLALKKVSDGTPWKDFKGLAWLDPSKKETWDYLAEIAKDSYDVGFDEINFDYVRYPSDGPMKDLDYALAPGETREGVMARFFAYIGQKLSDPAFYPNGKRPVLSADLFGLTTVSSDDLGIGQYMESVSPYFDYIDPMVYPSHYAKGFEGYDNPAKYPYKVVHFSLSSAKARLEAATTTKAQLRPWLQAFDLGAVYTPDMIKKEIRATYDTGISSWMLWDAANKYISAAKLLRAGPTATTTAAVEGATTTATSTHTQ